MLSLVCCFTTAASRPVKLLAKTFQHTRMRMPSATCVSADYDDGIITLSISAYTGNVQVYVYDSNGNIVAYACSAISGSGTLNINVDYLTEGDYTLSIALDNGTYSGKFQA